MTDCKLDHTTSFDCIVLISPVRSWFVASCQLCAVRPPVPVITKLTHWRPQHHSRHHRWWCDGAQQLNYLDQRKQDVELPRQGERREFITTGGDLIFAYTRFLSAVVVVVAVQSLMFIDLDRLQSVADNVRLDLVWGDLLSRNLPVAGFSRRATKLLTIRARWALFRTPSFLMSASL